MREKEKYSESSDLSAWRGILYGVLLGVGIWAFILLVLWIWLF